LVLHLRPIAHQRPACKTTLVDVRVWIFSHCTSAGSA
jgi:hypothetical protein